MPTVAGGYGIGVDIGSTATKVAVLDAGGAIVHTELMPTGFSSVDAADRVESALRAAGFPVDDPGTRVVATGYGRIAVPYADKVVTEITCHGIGAARLFGPTGTVVDVGGQDTKVIQLKGGRVAKFAMNDKCAAGTGRFLEIMADRLGVSQAELSALAREGSETKISSMCTVFAESEVISKLSEGQPIPDIVAGIHTSVVERTAGLARRLGVKAPVVMTGGVALNKRLRERLADKLGQDIQTNEDSQLIGALGAALHALEKHGAR